MIVRFNNIFLSNLYQGKLKGGKYKFDLVVIEKFKRAIKILQNVENLMELKKINGLNFEALKKEYKGFYSVRVDLKYRLIITIEKDNILIEDIIYIEDLTNHYK